MNSNQQLLARVDIFKDLPDEMMQEFASALRETSHPAGTALIHKGDEGNSMYVIAKGRVKIHDGEHTVAVLEEGNFFGEFSLLDAAPRSMSVTALDDVKMIVIEREHFYELMHNQPEITRKMVSTLTRRLRNQNDAIIKQLRTREEELSRLVDERTKELQLKNEEITIKNREITDNVRYAKKIQSAILPEVNLLTLSFPDSFVFYMPKDIVSGDFYAFFTHGESFTVVAADCTGHGVTGAMLSVIGSSLLNKIINERNIIEPGKILDLLNEEFIYALNQQSSDLNDGMDISICVIDKRNHIARFAGANRPLWIVRNGELLSFAPDKFPVGGMQIDHSVGFHTQEIPLLENDSIYLFTDGYADQFGGPAGKKIMTKKFKDILTSAHSHTMSRQMDHMVDFFNLWKKDAEQVDDVLVIGLRYKNEFTE